MKKATALLLALMLCVGLVPAALAATSAPAIVSATSPILYGYAANVKVTVSDAPSGAYVLFDEAVSAPVSGGYAMLRLEASDLAAYQAGGFASVALKNASGDTLAAAPVEIKDENLNIWEMEAAYAQGALRLVFHAPVYFRGTNQGALTVKDVGDFACYTSEESPSYLDAPGLPDLEPGTYNVKVSKVKLECFPSYSFTFSASFTVEDTSSVLLTDAYETKQLRELVPSAASNDGLGNIAVQYDVTGLFAADPNLQIHTFPNFVIRNVEDVSKLTAHVGNHEWPGYSGLTMGEVSPGVYQVTSGNAVHWDSSHAYPDHVIWTVFYDGQAVGTFKVEVGVAA